MDGFTPQVAMYLLGAALLGLAAGWAFRGVQGNRRIGRLSDEWQLKLDNFIRQRDRLTAETATLRAEIESQQGAIHRHETAVAKATTELNSAREKEKQMSKDLFTLRSEREEFKTKMNAFQNALLQVKRQATELQEEFIKSREFYKGELTKSFEKRQLLEAKLQDARLEQESFDNLLKSSRSEHESVNKMLAAAQTRLGNIDRLEQKAIELEADNAQLKHDLAKAHQQVEVLERDVEEMDELKVQNKELSHCLQSMEASRKQYEADARRYKEYAGETEKKSETLRIKLDEVEQNFLDIEKQQRQALKDARKATVAKKSNGKAEPEPEKDNLQEIVGIGKVFEQALHELGIFTFKQIANFGIADIARVNSELKEFKGRMEQDDWIGQAKELHFKKYGS